MTEDTRAQQANGFKTAFPPLLIVLQQHQAWLRDAANALLHQGCPAAAVPIPKEALRAGRRIVEQLVEASLQAAWTEAERLFDQFDALSAECIEAARQDQAERAASALDQLFGVESALIELLAASSIGEISRRFTAREQELAQRYERDFLDAAHIGRFSVRMSDQALVSCDDSFAALFDATVARLRNRDVRALIGEDAWSKLTRGIRAGETRRVTARLSNGKAKTLEIVAYTTSTGSRSMLHGFVVNRSQAEAEAQQRKLLSSAIEASDQVVLITDAAHKIVYVNGAFTRVTGYSAQEALGRSPRFLQGPATNKGTLTAVREAVAAGRSTIVELLNYRRSGEPYWVEMSIVPVTNSEGEITHWVAVQHDITARKAQEAEVTRLAMEDYLTGLPNRRAAEARLGIEWSRARRQAGSFAVAIADVDRFKQVNDQYGHQAGDQALIHIARALTQSKRGGDWIARWGGEEFLICLHDLDAPGALVAGERMRMLVRNSPLHLAQGELRLTVSIGIAMYSSECDSVDALIRQADALLYEAKRSGRDRTLCSGAGINQSAQWEGGQVHNAIQEGRVVAAYQPIIDLRSGDTVGEEALARIVLPGNELVPAQRFIASAEALRLISAIDRIVTALALDRGARATRSGAPARARFINLSPQFLADPGQVDALLERARALGILGNGGAQPFVIELGEREMADIKLLHQRLRPLVESGFSLALDDFGSGQGSFAYLADLPLSFLKIEGWMVRRIVQDVRVRQLVAGIVSTAKNFALRTVAECVEDGQAAQVLCDLGVDWAQGYFFAAPDVLQ
ncbi:MAG TPA: EAL domain-containing protein [Burkholderiales bacterium]|nr:EAL domain-containing protein [Burkholderiales bacterium]